MARAAELGEFCFQLRDFGAHDEATMLDHPRHCSLNSGSDAPCLRSKINERQGGRFWLGSLGSAMRHR